LGLAPAHPATINSLALLGSAYLEKKRYADAERRLRECLELRQKKQPDDWRRFQTMSQLGAALAGQLKYAEAERMLIDAFDGLLARETQIGTRRKRELVDAGARIAALYEAWGQPAAAARWRERTAAGGEKRP
jgi:hypothetical protein